MQKTLSTKAFGLADIKTSYCIDLDTRDRQVAENIKRIPGRVQPHKDRDDRIAVVCYGPSLEETWPQLREFDKIITVSGAHKFLIDRGIIPTWHAEVDPRPHKADLIGQPHKEVEYLAASVCHSAVFDLLEGHNVKLWHVFAHEAMREGIPVAYPRGEWSITGGSNVGLRAMVLARFLGFRKMTIFGMDYSFKSDGTQHAGWHPKEVPNIYAVEVAGRHYYTNPPMHQYAQQFFDEVAKIGDVDIDVVGEGLLQAQIREHIKTKPLVPPKRKPAMIAATLPPTITPEYAELNRKLHASDPSYGISGSKRAEVIRKLIETTKPMTILDYGCLHETAQIQTEDGLKSIRWIVENKYSGSVLSLSDTGSFVWNRVIGWMQKPNSGSRWVRLGICKGKTKPVVTDDHLCAVVADVLHPKIEFIPANGTGGAYLVRQVNLCSHNMRRENPLYNEDQLAALIGIGIGDGYFDKLGRMYNSHGLVQSEYVRFKQQLLGGAILRVGPSLTGKSKSDGLFFHCPTNAQTLELRSILYPEGVKTVKRIIKMVDSRALAFWYMDDGRLKIIHGKPYANFHTEGFSDADQELIAGFFRSQFSIDCSIYQGKNGKLIHCSRSGSERLFSLIAPYVHLSMEYKLPTEFRGCKKYRFNTTPLSYSAIRLRSAIELRSRLSSKLYDITVENTHNFVANRTVVHNCGKGSLGAALDRPIWEYDPCVPGKDAPPRPADLVIATDVLEHVEPECLGAVLLDISRCTLKVCYVVINTGPAIKVLADGRNAHLIQQPMDWWKEQLAAFFSVASIVQNGVEVTAVLGPKPKNEKKEAPPLDYSQRITPVRYKGTEVKFHTPNTHTQWRAQSLPTKEPATMEWIDTFNAGETFYDVGANVGGYSVWAAKRRGVKVLAFEPQAENYAILCRNLLLNQAEATAYCMAMTDTLRLSRLWLSSTEVGSAVHTFNVQLGPDLKERKGIPQGCVGFTLDMIAEKLGTPDHIKIDVDGLEHLVIAGAKNLLEQGAVKSLLVEVNGNLKEHQAMVAYLRDIGFEFDPQQVEKATRKEGNFKGCAEYVFRRSKHKLITPVDFTQAVIHLEPFKWLFMENVFSASEYADIRANLPKKYSPIAETRGVNGYDQRFTAEPTDPFWTILFARLRNGALKRQLCKIFGVDNPESLKDECLLIRDVAGYQIGPHTDSKAKVITVLFYLPSDESLIGAGTSIYVPRDPSFTCEGGPHYEAKDFQINHTMPFKPNSAFAFLKSNNSFHGVEPCEGTRDVLLYDIRKA